MTKLSRQILTKTFDRNCSVIQNIQVCMKRIPSFRLTYKETASKQGKEVKDNINKNLSFVKLALHMETSMSSVDYARDIFGLFFPVLWIQIQLDRQKFAGSGSVSI